MKKFLIEYPILVKEWHPTKNGSMTPKKFTHGSNKVVWWKCGNGHEWKTSINHRAGRGTRGTNCPYCSGRKASKENNLKILFPKISKEWDIEKNNELIPENFTAGSQEKIWWKCSFNHSWYTQINVRTKGHNCPICGNQTSKKEIRLFTEIQSIFSNTTWRKKIFKQEVDVYLDDYNIGFEYDGYYFHKNKRNIDKQKNINLEKNKIFLIRFREIALKKISKYDILVNDHDFLKKDIDKSLKILIKTFNNFSKKDLQKIYNYIDRVDFQNEIGFQKIIINLPSPPPEENLIKLFPKICSEWNYNKNELLKPSMFRPKSNVKIWWKCIKNHEWETSIAKRTNGTNCPHCSGRSDIPIEQKSLSYLYPDLITEWHFEKILANIQKKCTHNLKKKFGGDATKVMNGKQ